MRLATIPSTGEADPLRGDCDVISLSELKAAREFALSVDDSDVVLATKKNARERCSFDGQSLSESADEMNRQFNDQIHDCMDAKNAAEASIRNRDGRNLQRYGM